MNSAARPPALEGVPPMFTFDDPDGNRFVVESGP